MPIEVWDYLKGAVEVCDSGKINALIYVKSVGHRPINVGSTETCEVKLIRSGPTSPSVP